MENYENFKKRLAKSIIQGQINYENQKYGEFIKQTNEVQTILTVVIIMRSSIPDKSYTDNLYTKELGGLINLFQACAPRTPFAYALFLKLKKYQNDRNRLAHKMFSDKKLTPAECDEAISSGEYILDSLYKLAKIKKSLRPRRFK